MNVRAASKGEVTGYKASHVELNQLQYVMKLLNHVMSCYSIYNFIYREGEDTHVRLVE
jgi:hypothetical protein